MSPPPPNAFNVSLLTLSLENNATSNDIFPTSSSFVASIFWRNYIKIERIHIMIVGRKRRYKEGSVALSSSVTRGLKFAITYYKTLHLTH